MKQLSSAGLLLRIGAGRLFRPVPSKYVDNGPSPILVRRVGRPPVPAEVAVRCLCGSRPLVAFGHLAECGCGRWFMHLGDRVVAYRPEEEDVAA